jgi:hypothetical protein
MIGFGATSRFVHPCDVTVFDFDTARLRIRIDPKARERDKPVCLELDRGEAVSLLRRLSDVLHPEASLADA